MAFPDNQMQVLPYNRVVTDLHGHTVEGFLDVLKRHLSVREGGPATPSHRGEVAMYLAGRWQTLTLLSARDALDVDLRTATAALADVAEIRE